MSETESDKPSCRFCLSTKQLGKNKLITPCECRGSIEFVHIQCLNRWRHMDPARNGQKCLLCMTDYNLPDGNQLEELPYENTWCNVSLRFPVLLYGAVHYVWVFHIQYLHSDPFGRSYQRQIHYLLIPYQFIFQVLYFILFIAQWRVKNKKKYFSLFFSPMGFFIMSLHVISVLYFLNEMYIMTLPLFMILGLYYKLHKSVLLQINNELY